MTIIVPTFNERDNLPELYRRLQEAFAETRRPFELLVVDDDSPDGTADVAEHLGESVRALVRKGERGLATAVIWGLRHARHDLCVCMDADLSHPPEIVPALVARVCGGARFVLGSRYVSGGQTVDWSMSRQLNSSVATWLARPLTGIHDPMSGLFCCRRSDLSLDALDPVGYKIALEILVKSGFQAEEMPITFTDRLMGKSKMTMAQRRDYLIHLVRLYRWRWPLLAEIVSFCAVGSLGLIADLAALTALVEIVGLSFPAARIGGFLAAVSQNFVLNDHFTFRGPKVASALGRYLRFLLTSGAGMGINYAVSLSLFFGFPVLARLYWLPAIAGVLAGTALNFVGARAYAFRSAAERS